MAYFVTGDAFPTVWGFSAGIDQGNERQWVFLTQWGFSGLFLGGQTRRHMFPTHVGIVHCGILIKVS
jgi:hypothetical protein